MKVAVVMAARNYARYLPMAVRSVQAQTIDEWEMVIVDDGSTDGTTEVVRQFHDDRRIRYVRSDRQGQSRAKNLGVRLTAAPRIAFLDADDAWQPQKLERQLRFLGDHPEVGVVACGREFIGENDLDLPPQANAGITARYEPVDRDAIFVANPICFSSVMLRREVYDRIGGFDPGLDLAIDYDLWLRAAHHYSFACLQEKLVLYRTGHANLSKRQADRIATAFTIMRRHRRGVSPAARARGYGSTCRSMAWLLRSQSRRQALRWYLRAAQWPGQQLVSLKGIAGALLRRRPTVISPENRSQNL